VNRKWRFVLVLLTLTWWGAAPAAADKVKHFKDDQGTLHITNIKPEDQGKPGAESTPEGPLKLQVPGPQPAGGAFPSAETAEAPPPEESPEMQEPPPPEDPQEGDAPPDEGG